jgi:hypothetical protein
MQTYQFAHWLKGFMAAIGDRLTTGQVETIAEHLAMVQPDPEEPGELQAKQWLEKRITGINEAPNAERQELLLKRLHRDLTNDFAKHEAANDD